MRLSPSTADGRAARAAAPGRPPEYCGRSVGVAPQAQLDARDQIAVGPNDANALAWIAERQIGAFAYCHGGPDGEDTGSVPAAAVASRSVDDAWPRHRPQGLRHAPPASRLRPLTEMPWPSGWRSFRYGKCASAAEFRLNRAPSCEDIIRYNSRQPRRCPVQEIVEQFCEADPKLAGYAKDQNYLCTKRDGAPPRHQTRHTPFPIRRRIPRHPIARPMIRDFRVLSGCAG
jgi:hypothetical protein